MTPTRINNAAKYLSDVGIVESVDFLGTAPYSFGQLVATGQTRKFVAKHTK